MPLSDVSLKIGAVTAETIEIIVGPETYTFDRARFAAWMKGEEKDIWHTFRNVAIALGLSGVNLTDKAAASTFLATRTFKH